ncbi:mRNA-capping enzyme-like [Sitodiplosis mosellana]|uniref:mRNA-capping enzyme-like n=1 Tax=Sitodiplosis mosellana TaxID=263140 RepID=UPI00244466FF|nr:mRNA-capping enzyme-like [Sitodiplosis mosellana]
MVIDKDKKTGLTIPRYLIYDVVCYNGDSYIEYAFFSETLFSRLKCITENIIAPRLKAMQHCLINRDREPFGVRVKEFYDVIAAKKLLAPKFTESLGHETDGLIFQPSLEAYIPGQCNLVLKWKPLTMNSVDFKLKIGTESGAGILTKKVGNLYVGGLEQPFAQFPKLSTQIKQLDGKIIECKFEDNQWKFMRERTDKSFPNSFKTAMAVWESIQNPVTYEKLEKSIERLGNSAEHCGRSNIK